MPTWVAVFSGILGALVGGLISLATVFINRRFDDRRHLREIAIKTAFSHWQAQVDWVKANPGGKHVLPLDGYIVHMLLLSEMLSGGGITEDNVGERLAGISRVSDAAFDYARDTGKNKKADQKEGLPN